MTGKLDLAALRVKAERARESHHGYLLVAAEDGIALLELAQAAVGYPTEHEDIWTAADVAAVERFELALRPFA